MTRTAAYPLLLIVVVILLIPLGMVRAATVTGKFVTGDGKPLPNHELRFENSLTSDIYIAHTGTSGSFSVNLPPGDYRLRSDDGVVIKSPVVVGQSAVNVGNVAEPSGFDLWGLFQRQTIAPATVETPAPSTARIDTGSTGSASGSAQSSTGGSDVPSTGAK